MSSNYHSYRKQKKLFISKSKVPGIFTYACHMVTQTDNNYQQKIQLKWYDSFPFMERDAAAGQVKDFE
jgi:hypothetical protein